MTQGLLRRAQATVDAVFKIPSISTLLVIATLSLLVDASIHGLLFSTFLIAIAGGVAFSFTFKQALSALVRWGQRSRPRQFALQCVPSLLLTVSFLLSNVTIRPAHAQFLQGAETFFNTLIAGAGVPTNVVSLVFGVLRAIFVIYIAIAVIRVIVAARNDDDWTTLARTPLIVIMAIVIGDLTAGLVIGTGTPTTPAPGP